VGLHSLVSITTTLRDLWPEGKFIHFGDLLFKVIILFVFGFLLALATWELNERKLNKVADMKDTAV
jgi:hypothetical protein